MNCHHSRARLGRENWSLKIFHPVLRTRTLTHAWRQLCLQWAPANALSTVHRAAAVGQRTLGRLRTAPIRHGAFPLLRRNGSTSSTRTGGGCRTFAQPRPLATQRRTTSARAVAGVAAAGAHPVRNGCVAGRASRVSFLGCPPEPLMCCGAALPTHQAAERGGVQKQGVQRRHRRVGAQVGLALPSRVL